MPESHSSTSSRKRLCACDDCSSRKPSTSEPERPKSEVEKAVPIPESGACRPRRSASKRAIGSPASTGRSDITPATAAVASASPQKVPSRPRNISSPMR